MDSLSELLSAMSGISDVAAVVLAILVIVWIVNKFLEKQQEQQLLYIEQNNKTIKTISSYTQEITRLITLIENNLQETKKIGDEFDDFQSEVLKKIEELDKERKKCLERDQEMRQVD